MPDECANPLLLQWVKEWWDKAREQNSKGQFTYKKAHDSLRACPLPFVHPSQAQELRGLGPKLCERLTDKLREHCAATGEPMPADPRTAAGRKRPSDTAPSADGDDAGAEAAPAAKKPRARKPRTYVPALRSGAYAVMLALSTLPDAETRPHAGLTKNQVIDVAQAHCDSSFVAPAEPGKTYTAWSSMKTLMDKDLVCVGGGAARKYMLTDEGWEVVRRIWTAGGWDRCKILGDGAEAAGADAERVPARAGSVPAGGIGAQAAARREQRSSEPPPETGAPRKAFRLPSADLPDLDGAAVTRQRHRMPEIIDISSGDDSGDDPLDHMPSRAPKRTAPLPQMDAAERVSVVPESSLRARREASNDFVELASSSPPPPRRPPLQDKPPSMLNIKATPVPTALKDSAPTDAALPPIPADIHAVFIPSSSFTVDLLVDTREVRSRTDRTYLQDGLLALGIKPTTRALDLGDAQVVARVHDTAALSALGETGPVEVALPFIAERKRLDDLMASLKDGRFREQKFRLRRSGLRHVSYIVEEAGSAALPADARARWQAALRGAVAGTLALDGFSVRRSKGLDDSIRHLARLARAARAECDGAGGVWVLPRRALERLEAPAATRSQADRRLAEWSAAQARPVCLTYASFAERAAKEADRPVRAVFLRMLMATRGVTAFKARAIQRHYQTPRGLADAYKGLGRAEADDLLFGELGHWRLGRGKMGRAASAKVAAVWAGTGD